MKDETVWLSANQMAQLFMKDEKTIRKHINNVFKDEEVEEKTTRKNCVLMVLNNLLHFII